MLSKVAVLIINYNNWQDTITCLESVLKVKNQNLKIVLIDNGSLNDSVIQLKEWIKNKLNLQERETQVQILEYNIKLIFESENFTFISIDQNLGFAEGNNVGIEYILSHYYKIDYIFLLNNDATLDADCINICIEVAKKAEADIVGALVMDEKGEVVTFSGARFPKELFKKDKLQENLTAEYWDVDRVEGSGMLISRKLLEVRKKLLKFYFDPSLFLYGEDSEFCISAKKLGSKCVLARNAIIYHKTGSSSGGKISAISVYYGTRNRIILAKKLLPFWLKLGYLFWSIPTSIVRTLQYIILGKSHLAKAKLEGLIDGYKGVTGKWKKHENYINHESIS